MNIINFQKFLGTIIFGYFGIKIYYNLFLSSELKDSTKELTDFSTTCVLASIVYFFTNFEEVIPNSYIFYGGFIVGLNLILIKKIFFENLTDEVNNIILYLLIFVYALFFLYFYVAESSIVGGAFINPLIILISFISIIGGLLLTTRTVSTNDGVVRKVKLNMNMGILCWIGALLLVHTSSGNYPGTIVQSILIGCFVAYFSYFGPKYIFETENIPHSIPNLPTININDKDNIVSSINTLNQSSSNLNTTLNELNKNLSSSETQDITDEYKEFIITNRWISGLSLISVFVVVSLIYSKIGINMSPN